jgi:hypothetical protein
MAIYLIGIAIGVFFVVAALLGWEWVYGWWDVEVVRAILGESAARWYCATGGLVIVGMTIGYWARLW